MREAVRELAVVGQQDQPYCVDVETPHGVQAKRRRDERHDRRAALWVACGGHHPRGFVDRVHGERVSRAHRLAVDAHWL
jgi:hypothetical protein